MKIHKAILIQPEDKPKARVWDTPMPENNELNGTQIYDGDMTNQECWLLQSYKEYDIHPDYVEKFNNLTYNDWDQGRGISPPTTKMFKSALKQGIDLNPDLIKIIEPDTVYDNETLEKWKSSGKPYYYAILKEKVEESEDDIWDELYNLIGNEAKKKAPYTFNLPIVHNNVESILSVLKEKYTLKRK